MEAVDARINQIVVALFLTTVAMFDNLLHLASAIYKDSPIATGILEMGT